MLAHLAGRYPQPNNIFMGAEVAPGTNSLILVSGSREESGENGCNWNKGSNDDREVVFFVVCLRIERSYKQQTPRPHLYGSAG